MRHGISRRQLMGLSALLAMRGEGLAAAAPRARPPVCEAARRTTFPPSLDGYIRHLSAANDVFPLERHAEQIGALLGRLPDAKVLAACLPESLSAPALSTPKTTSRRKGKPLRIERRSYGPERTMSREAFLREWQSWLASLTPMRSANFEIFGVRALSERPQVIETDVRFDVTGGSREQRTGTWTLEWTRPRVEDSWTLRRLTAHIESRAQLSGPGFTDITASCFDLNAPGMRQLSEGIDYWRAVIDAASGIDVYGNNGIAAGDVDGSGYDSLYVCQPAGLPNRLFRNRGDGTFEDITEQSGAGLLDGTASALFVDFRNRGQQDLLICRLNGPLLFENLGGGRFAPRPNAFPFGKPPQGTFTSAAAADYNRDGLVDVYFCVYSFYQGLNQYQFPTPYYDAQNGPPNYLFRNRGDGTFEDVTAASGMNENNNRYSFGAAWCDYDGDGWPDLYVANDFGRKNLYRNNGDGTFSDVAAKTGVEDHGPGMSVCWVDANNDGRADVYVANMWLASGNRITQQPEFLPRTPEPVRALYRKHNRGNSLFRNDGNGTFADVSEQAGANVGYWSWSCAAWDYDNDGHSDIYVANGFISGPNREELTNFFWRQVAQRSLPAGGAEYELGWNAINELLRSDYTWDGYQRNVMFANHGDGTFCGVGGALGLDFEDDSRAFALADFDGDGRVEIALKNRTGPQLRLLRNDLELTGNGVSFRLRGVKSNRDAIGAVVQVETAAGRQTRFVEAGSGFASQHTKDLFFGVGEHRGSIRVRVQWPQGLVQEFRDVPVNHRIFIEEGKAEFRTAAYKARTLKQAAERSASIETGGVVWLVEPFHGPALPQKYKGQAALVVFVRADCQPSVDQVAKLKTLELPIVQVDESAAGAWSIFYRYLFDRRREMPVPTTFLVNEDGAVVAVYTGLQEAATIANDWKKAPRTTVERMAKAFPFPGRFHESSIRRDYFTHGIAYVQHGHIDEARAAFERTIAVTPNYADAWFNLGTIYLNSKAYSQARKHLTEAIRLNAADADAWNNLAMVAAEEGQFEEAVTRFREALRLKPSHVMAMQNLVRVYRFQNRLDLAKQALNEAIRQEPEVADLQFGLGMVLVELNELDQAAGVFERVLQLRPHDPETLNNLGVVLLRLGRVNEAVARFEECRRTAPDYDRSYLNLAMVYREQGKREQARQLLREYASKHPENEMVKQALAQLE